jgi:hypothetical protein
MKPGYKLQWIARALTISLASFMLVGIMVLTATSEDGRGDYGVEWHEPYFVSVETVTSDPVNGSFLITIKLYDSWLQVTEWDGELSLELADESNVMVYSETLQVRALDFTTTKTDDVVDTKLDITVPFEVLDHVTERMVSNTQIDMAIRTTFTYGRTVLTGSTWWWSAPVGHRVQDVMVNEENELVELNLLLFDRDGKTTKWDGDLHLVITDSTGFVMYDGIEPVEAREFNSFTFGRTAWLWYNTWVPFSDMALSMDRVEDENENGSGRTMMMDAWFSTVDGQVEAYRGEVDTGGISHPIPDALLLGNELPRVVLEADRVGLAGREVHFDASGTTDDLGTSGLRYEWSWGDGSLREVTQTPQVDHTFARAGSFYVELRVIDLDGASSTTGAQVDVFRDPGEGLEDDDDVARLPDWFADSYLSARMSEIIPFTGRSAS